MRSIACAAASGQLWVMEMGPLGGDELNVIAAGKNYGWPIVSNGDNYDSSTIPDHPAHKEFEAPIRSWTPVISPSGMLFYGGSLFPAWRGKVLVGGLSSQAIVRLTVDGHAHRQRGAHRHEAPHPRRHRGAGRSGPGARGREERRAAAAHSAGGTAGGGSGSPEVRKGKAGRNISTRPA